jgi:hypothetical protein
LLFDLICERESGDTSESALKRILWVLKIAEVADKYDVPDLTGFAVEFFRDGLNDWLDAVSEDEDPQQCASTFREIVNRVYDTATEYKDPILGELLYVGARMCGARDDLRDYRPGFRAFLLDITKEIPEFGRDVLQEMLRKNAIIFLEPMEMSICDTCGRLHGKLTRSSGCWTCSS